MGNTPLQIQILLQTTSEYLDVSFEMHHNWPYYDVDFYVEIFYPIDYVDVDFVIHVPVHDDWPFRVVVPADDQIAHHFYYIVPTDEFYDIGLWAALEYHQDYEFYISVDAQLDWDIEIYVDYVTEEKFFYVVIEELEYFDRDFSATLAEYGDINLFIPTPGYLDIGFLFSTDTAYTESDFITNVVTPYQDDFSDHQFVAYMNYEGDVSVSYHIGLVPQYRTVNRIRFKEHAQYGSINFSLLYQQDIDEPFQLFNINNATINDLPVPFGDPLLTNPVIGNIHRTSEWIDIFVDPVICTSVKMIIFETEDVRNRVRILEFGVFEDIIDVYTDVVHVKLDPKTYHLKSLEQFDDIWYDILVVNIQPNMEDDVSTYYTDVNFVKFIPTHTPPEEYYVDLLQLHIMQTFYFVDINFNLVDSAPYYDTEFFVYTPGHEDVSFWMGEWIYLDVNFYFEGGISYEDVEFYSKQLADTPLDTDFLTYVPDFEDINTSMYGYFEDGNEPPFILQSDINNYFVDINIGLAEYVDMDFEVMVPSYEEITFFMRHWNYLDVTFLMNSQIGGYLDRNFFVGVNIETIKSWPFLVYSFDDGYVDTEFTIYSVAPWYDVEFDLRDDQPYIDITFRLGSTRKTEQELYGSFDISLTTDMSLPGSFDIINTPVRQELYGSFDIAKISGRSLVTITILNPEDKSRLDKAGITVV